MHKMCASRPPAARRFCARATGDCGSVFGRLSETNGRGPDSAPIDQSGKEECTLPLSSAAMWWWSRGFAQKSPGSVAPAEDFRPTGSIL
jgi:hypothetical protein